jgi:putative ABC transport system permease protein
MALRARLASLWRGLFRRDSAERELDEELSSYIEMVVDENVRRGMSEPEARRRALAEAGGIEQVKEQTRDMRAGIFLETAARDLRQGMRSLLRTPGFAAAALTALALGIGASTAIFSVVEAVLLRPLPYRDPGKLVVIMHNVDEPVAPANFLDWRRQSTVYEQMGAADLWVPNLTDGDTPESVEAVRVTSDVLPLLGVRPKLGRLFLPEEETPGKDRTVILSDRLWRRRFASDPGVLGRGIHLNGEIYTVVGVMPPGFEFPPFWARGTELWAPLALGARAASRDAQSLRLFARLKSGATLAAARAEMATITSRLEHEFPGSNRDVTVTPLRELVVGSVRTALLVLLAAVGFLLLIACANVTHMLLARATTRQKEIAVRSALGASRARIVRHVLTESVVLALAGGVFGLLLSVAGVRFLVALAPQVLPRLETIRLDPWVLLFAFGLSLLTGIAFGLAPALEASRRDPARALRSEERGSTEGGRRSRTRQLLVGSEVAFALLLLVGAGLMIRSFAALRNVDPGFNPRDVLTMIVSVAGSTEAAPGRRANFYRELLEKVRAVPGVLSAGAINHLPLAGDIWGWSFTIAGRPKPRPGENSLATYRVVLPGYFRTMRIPILRGRAISDGDRLGTPGVVVVNQQLAERYFPGEDPLGKRITFDNGESNPEWLTVVGVVKNAARDQWGAAPYPEVYLPYLQNRNYLERPAAVYAYMTLVVRGNGDPSHLAPAVRGVIHALDPSVTVSEVQTMDEVVGGSTAGPRFYLLLLGVFASIALILASVGIYGVVSYTVSRRSHEIGIRIALGAGRREVERLVVREAMGPALAGAASGLAAAFALTRLMKSLLYRIGSTDPATFALVCAGLVAVALAASWLPARRAARIDPLEAIRNQ